MKKVLIQYKSFDFWLISLMLLLYSLAITVPINLTAADLGRHIKSGQVMIQTSQVQRTNLFSYTYPDYPFIDHHWASGVIFYLVYAVFGFNGLSIFFTLISIATLIFFGDIARRHSSIKIGLISFIITFPLLVDRTEIRPEIFSYLFAGLFFWILWRIKEQQLNIRWLYLLPVVMMLWVNLHIYFIFGLGLIGLFGLGELIDYWLNKTKSLALIQKLILVGSVTAVVTLLNPNGLTGALLPFQIYHNYGYRVLEEQSVSFIQNVLPLPSLAYYYFILITLVASWGYQIYQLRHNPKKISVELLALSLVTSVMGFVMIRNFSLFALFALPVIAINLSQIPPLKIEESQKKMFIGLGFGLLILIVSMISPQFWPTHTQPNIGLAPGVDLAAKFYLDHHLPGPVFNNYDNGGYLIFYLYPSQKVFVDNRPEVYPSEFFQQTYIPMQEDDRIWQQQDQKYHFNTIFFYRHDATPWAQKFLVARFQDPDWAVIYVDNYSIIYVKRNDQNRQIISQYEIPKELFSVR